MISIPPILEEIRKVAEGDLPKDKYGVPTATGQALTKMLGEDPVGFVGDWKKLEEQYMEAVGESPKDEVKTDFGYEAAKKAALDWLGKQ